MTTLKPRFKFSLKFAIGVLTVAAFATAYLWPRFERARRQANAVASITQASQFNKCFYDYQTTDELVFDSPVVISIAESRVPEWLLNWFGVDFFHNVNFIDVMNRDTSEAELLKPILSLGQVKFLKAWFLPAEVFPNVCNCRAIEYLDIGGSFLVDLSPIQNLKRLKHLDISNTGVSDLTPISKLTELKRLILPQTPVRDLSPLAKLTNLKQLVIEQTKVDDISPISHLTQLTVLKASHTPLASLRPLEKLTNLDTLNISIDSKTKDQLSSLRGLTKLRSLIISGNENELIEDASFLTDLDQLIVLIIHDIKLEAPNLTILKRLKNLQYLSFSSTTISDDDIESLRQALPLCQHLAVNGITIKSNTVATATQNSATQKSATPRQVSDE